MRVITFQPQFHDLIESGRKTSTIRLRARCKPGDTLSLRAWTGLPYRSKQRELRSVTCAAVRPIRLLMRAHHGFALLLIAIEGQEIDCQTRAELAQKEGFDGVIEMTQWFAANHKMKPGDVLEAELIEW